MSAAGVYAAGSGVCGSCIVVLAMRLVFDVCHDEHGY